MSVRLPQTVLDRLSGLSVGNASPEPGSPSHHHHHPPDSNETTGLVQRCVIVQKDQHGFGFTVSGDRIVLVQSVRQGGAAMRAGVQEGDRIVKVNGTMVTNSSHLEVVKLIKSGAYVALTLLGSPPPSAGVSGLPQEFGASGVHRRAQMSPPPPPPPPLPPPQRITGPKPLQDSEVQKHATQILRNMLRQEETELQSLCEVYSRSPAALIEEQIEGARRRVHQLQLKIRQETMGPAESLRSQSDTSPACVRVVEGRLSMDSQDSGLDSGTERFPSISEYSLNRNSVLSDPGLDSPRTSPLISSKIFQHHRRQGSDTPFTPNLEFGLDRSPKPLIIGPEEDYDPGYYVSECDELFQDLEKLKSRPAHLGVFLRYIFSQADPNPLLFYLCAEVCQQMSLKDARILGKEVSSIFLDKNAPLKVKVPEPLLADLDARMRNSEDVRSAFSEAQDSVLSEIQEQIQDYRTKRTMGLGSLYGENDLQDLDSDPQKERQIAEKQISQLGDILSRYEEDRSSPMAFALNTYMTYVGIRTRDARPASTSEKSPAFPDKDKWLPFFPKAKKTSNAKKDKESVEDKRRNPILKYIGKPKSGSQSIKPGNVRNIILHFENNQHYDPQELVLQRLSTGSIHEELLDSERAEVKLGRSESLKGRDEMKKSRKADNVPRSRSDVDMDAAAEATRLHQSASSSASSLSTRSLENATPPYTPKMGRRSIESPNLGFGGSDSLLPNLLEDELGHLSDLEPEPDSQNWQHTVGREVAPHLPQKERGRQEVIHELFVTEASHSRILRVMDLIFYQRMKKENLLTHDELLLLFPNLPELIEIHNSLAESMKKLREEGPIIREIGDLMLSRFDGLAGEEIQQEAARFCCFQSFALELIKTKQRKEPRFHLFMQEAESSPQCRRLQLKDLIVSEMQRLTKYPLLLDNIIKHTNGGTSEQEKLYRCRDRCRAILKYVNEGVKQTENQHRLKVYQKQLDTTALERAINNPLAAEFKNLDLTTRRMIHEGPLTWRIAKDKTVDAHVLLLEDLLVLLQKQDEKLVLKCHSKTTLGASDIRQTFSPVIKLNSVLVRAVATDKRALFIICTSELGPQIYELVALTSLEKNTWKERIEEAVKGATRINSCPLKEMGNHTPPAVSVVLQDAVVAPILSAGNYSMPNLEDVALDDHNPANLLSRGNHPVITQQPETACNEEEEAPVTPTQLTVPMEEEEGKAHSVDCFQRDTFLPLQAQGGLANSALEDVMNLRHLILRNLLPHRGSDFGRGLDLATELEDDLTPTPSLVGSVGHTLDSVTFHQDTPLKTCDSWGPTEGEGCTVGHSESSSESCRTDYGTGDCTSSKHMDDTGLRLQEGQRRDSIHQQPEFQQLEAHVLLEEKFSHGRGSFKVVRKAEVVGNNIIIPLPGSSHSETELQDVGGGANLDGNYFYVAMPAAPPDSSTDDDHASSLEDGCCPVGTESLTGPSTLNVQKTGDRNSREIRPPSGSTATALSLTESPAPSLVIRDVDMIFKTIEQLTLKLNMLKEMEAAHRELLKSFGGAPSGDVVIVGDTMGETDKQTKQYQSTTGNCNSSSFARTVQSVSVTVDGIASASDEASTLVTSSMGTE
ncbi:rho guanine nucleotide exchange factor 11 isoform X2 [Ambystoma mexicanum]|uniref:rho guanine nucleotide exchange factor 11 isoform X2 n=1 Tax=Ambystoma mexicanum TaxID=8296 RepID=UPI0037E76DC5